MALVVRLNGFGSPVCYRNHGACMAAWPRPWCLIGARNSANRKLCTAIC